VLGEDDIVADCNGGEIAHTIRRDRDVVQSDHFGGATGYGGTDRDLGRHHAALGGALDSVRSALSRLLGFGHRRHRFLGSARMRRAALFFTWQNTP
jgi:hypothetical protein